MLHITKAQEQDLQIIYDFIYELAEYEEKGDSCIITLEELSKLMFQDRILHGIIAYQNEEIAGFATYFYMASTFKGKKILYMEDLFIREQYRGRGIGKELTNTIFNIAKQENCSGMEWKCLKWNQSAKKFYHEFGGIMDEEWDTYFKNIN